ncbi:MHC class II transactivator isoform X3 [Engraulis encrasicolus]|uniref:MHC class II transactivator isoform X3 n=1 Tax=Engraulis encrasicolus TaxID=184585 RepID=UPI002FCE9CE5
MLEDSVMVTFDRVLEQLRWVLQVATSQELHVLMERLLEAQVFPSYHYLSLGEGLHSVWERDTSEAEREDQARRMALPVWQKWDVCQGILQPLLPQQETLPLDLECTCNSSDSVGMALRKALCPSPGSDTITEEGDDFWETWDFRTIFNNFGDGVDLAALEDVYSDPEDPVEMAYRKAVEGRCSPGFDNITEEGVTDIYQEIFGKPNPNQGLEQHTEQAPSASLVSKAPDQLSTWKKEGRRSLQKRSRSRCPKSRAKETDAVCQPKRSKKSKATQRCNESSTDSSAGDNTQSIVPHVVPHVVPPPSPQWIFSVSPSAFVSVAGFNPAALLPPADRAPHQSTHTHSPNPTYIIASPFPFTVTPVTPQNPQVVPLSPISGTVAPEILSVTPGSSLSDRVNRTTPAPVPLHSPTLVAAGPVSPSMAHMVSPGSSSPNCTNRFLCVEPTTAPSPPGSRSAESSEDVATNPQQAEQLPSCVQSYSQLVKSSMKESCDELRRGMTMDSHYIDVHLRQRKVLGTSGNNTKCLEKVMAIASDTDQQKVTLTRKQVFTDSQMKQKHVTILLGRPGAGKSTFIKRLCLDWAKGGLPRFRYLFLLNCKTLNLTRPDYSLKRLLFDLSTSPRCEDSESVFKHLLSAPREVLIIFDGFEDFKDHGGLLHSPATCTESGGFSIKDLFSGLFLKRFLKGCTLLIASRPSGALTPLLRKADCILELPGFSPEEIDSYTSLYFPDEARGASALTKMKQQKYVYSLCSNPLLCRYTCFLLEHSDNKRYTLPSTLTGLMLRVLSLSLQLASQTQDRGASDISQLCPLAWEFLSTHSCLMSEEQLGSTEIRDHGLSSEILTSHTVGGTNGAEVTTTTSYSFTHGLIQNLLASMHLVTSDSVSDKALANQIMGRNWRRRAQGEWLGVVQQMTVGLLFQSGKIPETIISHITTDNTSKAKKKAVEAHLESLKSIDLAPARLLELGHCVYETSSKKLMKQLVSGLPDNISLCGAQLTPPDVYVLWHVLQDTSAHTRQFSIDLQDTGITVNGLKDLVGLNCVSSYRAALVDVISLWKGLQQEGDIALLTSAMNKLTLHPFKATQEDHIDHLAALLRICEERRNSQSHRDPASVEHDIPAIKQLEKLDFELGPSIAPMVFPKFARILPSLGNLMHLDLEKNRIGDSGAEQLADVLHSLSSLKMLNLSQNFIGDKGLEKLAPGLAAAPSLQSLSLYNNLIDEHGAERLALVLPEMSSLIDLDVCVNLFTDVGAQKLSDSLKRCPWIKSLGLWNRHLPPRLLQNLNQQDRRIKIQFL